jgi:SAM-dependent methyltransferase
VPERAEPDPFRDSFIGMIAARALQSAVVLGVFDALHERPGTADELAERLDLDPAGAEALAGALVALGYLERDGPALANAPVSERLLVRSSPESIATFIGEQGELHWQVLDLVPDAVRGRRVFALHEKRWEDGPLWEGYIRGLFEISRAESAANAALVPVRSPRRLVDVAGGHGGFAMAMCRRHPGLSATVVDLPPSAAVGRRIVAEEGFAERVSFHEGDVFEAGLEPGVDVVSVFNLVHHLPDVRVRELFTMARAALASGGCLVIGDTARPEPGEDASANGAMSSLLFHAWSGGRNLSVGELRRRLGEAGFDPVEAHHGVLAPWRVLMLARA